MFNKFLHLTRFTIIFLLLNNGPSSQDKISHLYYLHSTKGLKFSMKVKESVGHVVMSVLYFFFFVTLFFSAPVHSYDAAVILGADNNVITNFRIILKTTGGDRIVHDNSTTQSNFPIEFHGLSGRVRTIAFWLLNDGDPRANGKDVNLIIRHVVVDSVEVFPSPLYDFGIVERQCKRTGGSSSAPPPNCPRIYKNGESMVLPWNDVRYKLLNLEVVDHPVDQNHRQLFCGHGHCPYFGTHCVQGYCLKRCSRLHLTPGEGLTSYRKDWTFSTTKDHDKRTSQCHIGESYEEALDLAFKLTGVPRSEFVPTLYNKNLYDFPTTCVPVEWKAPNFIGAEVNVDIPEQYHYTGSGPFQPHIGYKQPGKDGIAGHIFIDSHKIKAGRPAPGEEGCDPDQEY